MKFAGKGKHRKMNTEILPGRRGEIAREEEGQKEKKNMYKKKYIKKISRRKRS